MEEDGHGQGGLGRPGYDRDRLVRRPDESTEERPAEEEKQWVVGRARRTAKCMGEWEYEIGERNEQGEERTCKGQWVRGTRVPAQVGKEQLREARERRVVPESLRARLEKQGSGDGRVSSVGRWQVALTGDPQKQETVQAVEKLVAVWWAHVQEAGEQGRVGSA